MGIWKALFGSVNGIMSEQWKEYFICNSLAYDTLMIRGRKVTTERSSNTKSDPNVITDGSLVVVNEGQAAIVTEAAKVIYTCENPGEHIFRSESTPSIFGPSGGKGIGKELKNRIAFGGTVPITQRIYYVNTKECGPFPFATPAPVGFRVVDSNTGLDMDAGASCSGCYSFRICDPALFYKNVTGNIADSYTVYPLVHMMDAEILTVLQSALASACSSGIRPYELSQKTETVADILRSEMNQKWASIRGIQVVSIGISGLSLDSYDKAVVQGLQADAVLRNPEMAAATMTGALADAMKSAASNPHGAVGGMAGLYAAGSSPYAADQIPWTCSSCGAVTTGRFCKKCGKPRPKGWTCSCGKVNQGKFCEACGKPRP